MEVHGGSVARFQEKFHGASGPKAVVWLSNLMNLTVLNMFYELCATNGRAFLGGKIEDK